MTDFIVTFNLNRIGTRIYSAPPTSIVSLPRPLGRTTTPLASISAVNNVRVTKLWEFSYSHVNHCVEAVEYGRLVSEHNFPSGAVPGRHFYFGTDSLQVAVSVVAQMLRMEVGLDLGDLQAAGLGFGASANTSGVEIQEVYGFHPPTGLTSGEPMAVPGPAADGSGYPRVPVATVYTPDN